EELWDEAKGTDKYYGPVIGERNGEPLIEINASIASPGDFFDAAAIHLITRNTLDELSRREPESRFEVRRFRPNIVVDVADTEGFVENDWKVMRSGALEMRTLLPVPRCVMTTLPQGDLPKDRNVLRAAAVHNMVDTKVVGVMPCAGLYAMVATGGDLRVADTLTADA
ncbi:MAG: MOSC domain-containing protein, partial [Actinomycetota bacterium]